MARPMACWNRDDQSGTGSAGEPAKFINLTHSCAILGTRCGFYGVANRLRAASLFGTLKSGLSTLPKFA